MTAKLAALGCGAAFGFLISWGQFSSPDRIREMLLLEDLYLYQMMLTAMAVGFLGLRVLRRYKAHSLFTGDLVSWEPQRPRANHVVGGVVFGLGWAVTDACPGPVAAQLGQGVGWSLFTLAGLLLGIELYLRRQEQTALEPSPEDAPAVRSSRPGRPAAGTAAS